MLNLGTLPTRSQSKGFGVVEILVSIIISLILFAGVLNLFQSNKRAYQIEMNLGQLQQNGRFATTFLNRTIRIAHFPSQPDFEKEEYYKDYEEFFPAGSKLIGGANNDTNGNDTLTVSYQGTNTGNIFDCLASPVQTNQLAVSTFFVNAGGQLVCAAVNNGVANLSNPDILVDNVEVMLVRFGEDTDSDGIVNRYVPANHPDLQIQRVLSVRVSLLLKTPDATSSITDQKFYALQDTEVGPFNDNFLRKVYTTTVQIRSES